MSRNLSHLAELQPELFSEISPELAAELGVCNGDWVTVSSSRGSLEVRALVTDRISPLRLNGKTIHQVGLPYRGRPAFSSIWLPAVRLTIWWPSSRSRKSASWKGCSVCHVCSASIGAASLRFRLQRSAFGPLPFALRLLASMSKSLWPPGSLPEKYLRQIQNRN